GACLGAFVGALLGDLWAGRTLFQSLAAGRGAAMGRFWGTVVKLAIGAIMVIMLAIAAFVCRASPCADTVAPGAWPSAGISVVENLTVAEDLTMARVPALARPSAAHARMASPAIELTPEAHAVLELWEQTRQHVFLTG